MNQLALNFAPRARKHDPRTSHAAAASVDRFARGHYLLILEWLDTFLLPGGTFYEIARGIGLDGQQVNKRLPELERAGLVIATEHTRPGPSGRQCRVWRIA